VNLRVVRETSGAEQSPSICGQAIEDPRTSEFTSTGDRTERDSKRSFSFFSAKELLLSCVNSVDVYFAEREYVCKKASFAERERSVHYPVGAFSQTSDWHVYTAFAHR